MKQNGVIKQLSKENRSYYDVHDVMDMFGVSKDKAYTMIRTLRKELIDAGTISSVYPIGKVPKKYLNEKCMIL